MARARNGFTLIELAAVVAILGLLLAVLMPMGRRARNADGLSDSILNVSTLMVATHMYCADHAGGAPMRACGYSGGLVTGGWDGWNFGGKNCNVFWQTSSGGVFDEPAYARPLNMYIYPRRLRRPNGYVNSGSGSTWTLIHGTPSLADRTNVQIPVFRSPGDVATRQRVWPNPTPTISGYDDIGTSYILNMKWWDDPSLGGLGFSARYIEGARRIGLALGGANPNYVFMHDQIADVVANAGPTYQTPGEFFGKINYSVMGWADGRANYVRVIAGAASGPGYTFFP